jgi:hypothetical protein
MAEARPSQIRNIQMPDGTVRPWDMANEPKPDCVGNDSRSGFLWNCYTSSLGKFFQNTIKGGILSAIHRIHDREIPRYDKDAYTCTDPRVQFLDRIVKETIEEVIQDNDRDRKQKIAFMIWDIFKFVGLKEDIFYRPRILQAAVNISKKILEHEDLLTQMTDMEAYNLTRFGGLDGRDHLADFSDLPMEERAKLPKNWTGLP